MSPVTRYIIQVDRPGERVDMAAIRALLDEAGVALDPDYGPISINPKLGRYVVRGLASPGGRARGDRARGRGATVGGVDARPREVTEAGEVGFARVEGAGPLRRIPQAAVSNGDGSHSEDVGMSVRAVDRGARAGIAGAAPP